MNIISKVLEAISIAGTLVLSIPLIMHLLTYMDLCQSNPLDGIAMCPFFQVYSFIVTMFYIGPYSFWVVSASLLIKFIINGIKKGKVSYFNYISIAALIGMQILYPDIMGFEYFQ